MIIIIPHISNKTLKNELVDFVAPALKSVLPFSKGKVIRAEILKQFDKEINELECHGLVYVDNTDAGLRAILKLNKTMFKGTRVEVREYINRYYHNDRRHNHSNKPDPIGKGKRIGDRRRGNSISDDNSYSKLFSLDNNYKFDTKIRGAK